jgi:prophage regulatory protein
VTGQTVSTPAAVKPLYYDLEVLPDVVALSVSTIQQETREGRFPRPRQLSGRRVGYLVREVEEWAESRPVSDLPPPANTGAKKTGRRRRAVTPGAEAPAARGAPTAG